MTSPDIRATPWETWRARRGFHVRPVDAGRGLVAAPWRRPAAGPARRQRQRTRGTRARREADGAGSGRLTSSSSPDASTTGRPRARPADRSEGWMFYRPLPDEPLRKSDLIGFSLSLPGLGRELAMVLALALLGAMLGLVDSRGLRHHRRPGLAGGRPAPAGRRLCLFLVVLIVARAIFQAIQGLLVLRIEGRVSATLIPAFWDRLLRLPSRFFSRFSSGDLALRAMELSEVFKKVSGAAVATVVTGIFSFFNLALLYYYSWRLAMCTTFLLAILLCGDAFLLGGCCVTRARSAGSTARSPDLFLELLGGISTLRTAGAESRAFSRWARRYTERLGGHDPCPALRAIASESGWRFIRF